ncbi:MAG: outer membrane protein assembly factor BamB [Pseudomonas sp.]|nr:outer membrane protein assembly factor BamB [Pseudomonas sp.]MDD2222314.1 outer membrane protein assembly factor BamB [Pseudomonas sp.]MDY0413958.1 outer membrane protein assembly factor BamB [Pseudomonas sp.]NLO53464.1 outer membrane protein assembly factor BamB [Gammaproteobacteria bacterium]
MPNLKRYKYMAVLALALLAIGCSSTSKKELKPQELEKITTEIKLKKEWSKSVGSGQGKLWNTLIPATDGDLLFVSDVNGRVSALDRFTGKTVWKRKLKLNVSGGVGAGNGMVLLGTLNGDVIALNADTGADLWRSKVTSEVLAAPATNGDVVVVQTQDDRLIALEATTGQQRWIYESTPAVLSLRGTSAPVVTEYVAYAGLSTGKIIAVDTERGLPIWEQRIAVPSGRTELERMVDIDGGLLLSSNTLYVATYQGRFAGLDAQTGQVLWQREGSSYVGMAAGFANAYVSLADGTIESVDQRSATAMWTNSSLLRRQLSAPTVFSSYIAVGDLDGYLHVLSQVDGRFVARTKIDGKGLRVQPIEVGGWLYVYGNGGKLVALTIK